jgi:hypothetical protein
MKISGAAPALWAEGGKRQASSVKRQVGSELALPNLTPNLTIPGSPAKKDQNVGTTARHRPGRREYP